MRITDRFWSKFKEAQYLANSLFRNHVPMHTTLGGLVCVVGKFFLLMLENRNFYFSVAKIGKCGPFWGQNEALKIDTKNSLQNSGFNETLQDFLAPIVGTFIKIFIRF